MILESLFIFGGLYIALGLSIYIYAVVKTYEILGVWNFNITKESIGVCKYPYWTLFWLHMIIKYAKILRNYVKEGR